MPKKKLTDEQNELLALIPKGLPTMTRAEQLVLANIILQYGTEFASEHGFIYRTNEDMAHDTELTKQTVITAVRKLKLLGLLNSNRGQRGQASEYYLSDEIKQKINFSSTEIKSKPNEEVKECGTSKGQIKETMGQITKGQMTEFISQITNAVCEKMNEIITLKFNELNEVLRKSETLGKESYLTTESEIESEIEEETLSDIKQSNEKETVMISALNDNDYVSKVFDWLDNELDYLFKVKDVSVVNSMNDKIQQFVDNIDKSKLTEKQWEVVQKKMNRWKGIQNAKNRFFNLQPNKKMDDSKTVISLEDSCVDENDASSVSLIDSMSDNGTKAVSQKCREYSKEEAIEWASNDVKNYTSYESWEENTRKRFKRKYGDGWDCGNDRNAYLLYLQARFYARDHYEGKQPKINKETVQQADKEELAPWEVPNRSPLLYQS